MVILANKTLYLLFETSFGGGVGGMGYTSRERYLKVLMTSAMTVDRASNRLGSFRRFTSCLMVWKTLTSSNRLVALECLSLRVGLTITEPAGLLRSSGTVTGIFNTTWSFSTCY